MNSIARFVFSLRSIILQPILSKGLIPCSAPPSTSDSMDQCLDPLFPPATPTCGVHKQICSSTLHQLLRRSHSWGHEDLESERGGHEGRLKFRRKSEILHLIALISFVWPQEFGLKSKGESSLRKEAQTKKRLGTMRRNASMPPSAYERNEIGRTNASGLKSSGELQSIKGASSLTHVCPNLV